METTLPSVRSPTIFVVEPPISMPKITSMACFLSKGGRQVRDMQKPAAVLVMIGEQRCLVNVYL